VIELRKKSIGGDLFDHWTSCKVVVSIFGGAGGAGICLPRWRSYALEEGGWGRQVTSMYFLHGGEIWVVLI